MAELVRYSAHINHRVADADRWKTGFDDLETARRSAGILGHHINRAVDDPHRISIFLALADVDRAKAFTSSYELDEVRNRLGVVSRPRIHWLQPIRDAVVSHRQLPVLLVRQRVLDFDAWLAGYDAAGEPIRSAGIIGHAASRSLDDPASITVCLQAESFDALHGFLADPELQARVREGGIASPPEVTLHTGGWAKTY